MSIVKSTPVKLIVVLGLALALIFGHMAMTTSKPVFNATETVTVVDELTGKPAQIEVGKQPAAAAQAAWNQQVCNTATSGSVRVITNTGYKYNVVPGRCSGTNIVGVRPHYGNGIYLTNRYDSTTIVRWRGDNVYTGTINGPMKVSIIFVT